MNDVRYYISEFNLPLLSGVGLSLICANVVWLLYQSVVFWKPFGDIQLFGHDVTLQFLAIDVMMAFFFGLATKDITESFLPGGPLNPIRTAINPLVATLGGVFVPALLYILGIIWFYGSSPDFASIARGWAIPTATDIALVWLAARRIFGSTHPAVKFLLLLAVVDDGIGMAIIAIFFPNPDHPVELQYLCVVFLGMGAAYILRRQGCRSWLPYIACGGMLSWIGFTLSGLHPALALVPIVPFMPSAKTDLGLFVEQEVPDALDRFEHAVKFPVEIGLFFFAFVSAGVRLEAVSALTWVILSSLILGKTIGIYCFAKGAQYAGFPLPKGMEENKVLFVASFCAGIGLTVALFVTTQAYPPDSAYLGSAKMGAVLSGAVIPMAIALGRILGIKPERNSMKDEVVMEDGM